MSKIYIWGANDVGTMVRNCINETIHQMSGYIDNSSKLQGMVMDGYLVYSFDDIKYDASVKIIISAQKRYREIYDQIVLKGYEKNQIVCFFDVNEKQRYKSSVFISEEVCQDVCVVLEKDRLKRNKLGAWYNIEKELEVITESSSKKIVTIGKNEYCDYFIKKLEALPVVIWGRILNIDDPEEEHGLEDLMYEDFDTLSVYIFDTQKARKIEGYLIEMGITNFKKLCGDNTDDDTRMQDLYDPQIGYTWIEGDEPGFIHFIDEKKKETTYRIVTLGGSTTDATQVNIKSWSEYIFEMCRSLNGINVEIYAGGMGGYVSTQEMRKLLRDVLELQPDLVISYSGVNDAQPQIYYASGHPMCLKYEADYVQKGIRNNHIINTLSMTPVRDYTLGVTVNEGIAKHWVKCERIMKAVCKEFGIDFYGFLQPCNYGQLIEFYSMSEVQEIRGFFEEVKKIIFSMPNNDWLIDATSIFEEHNDVYYDACHVYEKGNRIIARTIMPYILKSIERGHNSVDFGNFMSLS